MEHELVIVMNKVTSRVKEHDCRINWGGSSKEMEIDLAVNILVSGTTEKARISTIIIAVFRNNSKNKKTVPHEVTKETEIYHDKKSVGNDICSLQKNHHIF